MSRVFDAPVAFATEDEMSEEDCCEFCGAPPEDQKDEHYEVCLREQEQGNLEPDSDATLGLRR